MSSVIDTLFMVYCTLSILTAIIYVQYIKNHNTADAERAKDNVTLRKDEIMFIEENMKVRAVTDSNTTYEGSVYRIVVQPCEDDNNRPHALIFISQEKENNRQNEEFGCIALWVDKLKSIDVVNGGRENYGKC